MLDTYLPYLPLVQLPSFSFWHLKIGVTPGLLGKHQFKALVDILVHAVLAVKG
jgi:hypothetical protein